MVDLYVLKRKSENMNLKFKSTPADLKFKLQSNKFDIINGNILYLTHEIDQIKKIVIAIQNNSQLQKQVDDYFDEDIRQNGPVTMPETSPQTDSDEQ